MDNILLVVLSICWANVASAFVGEMFVRDGRRWPYGIAPQRTYASLTRNEGDVYNMTPSCVRAMLEAAHLPGLHQDRSNYSKLDVMLDSIGKPGAGLLSRNLLWYGSYQQCSDLTDTMYCLNTLNVNLTALASQYSQVELGVCLPKVCNESDATNLLWSLDKIVTGPWKSAYAALQMFVDIYVDKKSAGSVCETSLPMTAGAIVSIAICCCLAVLLVLGSVVDWYMSQPHPVSYSFWINNARRNKTDLTSDHNINDGNSGGLESDPLLRSSPALTLSTQLVSYPDRNHGSWYTRALRCFSLQKNVLFVLDTKHRAASVPCLHGIRVFSMTWVILGHTYLWPQFVGCSNLHEMYKMVSQFSFQLVLNSTFAVDSFFVLSGMLVMFWTLRKVDSDGGSFSFLKFYLHRFLRLTPAYMFVLMLWTNLVQYWGGSPGWRWNMADHRVCATHWWTNLLYINNFYPSHLKGSCLGWTWYLALDMQFYLISPLVILSAHRFARVGLAVSVGVLMTGSLLATSMLVYINKFQIDGSLLLINDIFTDESTSFNGTKMTLESPLGAYESRIFDKPYCRIAPYLVGLCIGFMVRRLPSVSTTSFAKAPARWFAVFGWCVCLCLLVSPIYGLYGAYHSEESLSNTTTIFYYTFSRLAWALGVGWLILACFAGYGGYINSFFSHGLWLPLSRLTFSTYLVHPVLLYLLFLGLDVPVYYTNVSMVAYFLAALISSYAAAFILTVAVEVPFVELEKMVLKT